MRKFFGLAHGRFRLLMPLLFNRYFAGHGSLPDVLKAGVFSEIRAYRIIKRPSGFQPKNWKLGKNSPQLMRSRGPPGGFRPPRDPADRLRRDAILRRSPPALARHKALA